MLGQLLLCATTTQSMAVDSPIDCAAELDATVALASNADSDTDALAAKFESLEKSCPDFAQIAHNRGVLSGRDDRWSQAISHFERSLKKDARAAQTHQHLQQIFDYRAAIAYANALGTDNEISEPVLSFQDSSDQNSQQQNPDNSQLRDIVTIEYELFAWWQALKTGNGIDDHYIDGYDSSAILQARQQHSARQWQREAMDTQIVATLAALEEGDIKLARLLARQLAWRFPESQLGQLIHADLESAAAL